MDPTVEMYNFGKEKDGSSDSEDQKSYNAIRLDNAISFSSEINVSTIKDAMLISICEKWPAIQCEEGSEDYSEDSEDSNNYNDLECNINLFNNLYSFASSDDTKADLIIAITNNTTLDKEFRKQIIEDKVPAERLKTKLLTSIETGKPFQAGDTKSGAN